jgi:polar amino acid transport system substrate-binding protein
MHRRTLCGLALSLACGVAPARPADGRKLHIVTSHLPPLVLEPGPPNRGALHELVIELVQRLRMTPEMDFVPWRRAVFLASNMSATTIFPLTRLPAREAQFRWLAPLYEENYVFLAPRQGRFDIRRPGDMKAGRIAVLRGAFQVAILRELGYRRIVEANSIREVHRFLVEGMADASFGERAIIQSSLAAHGAKDDFHVTAPLRSSTAWLAGSLDFSEAEEAQFQRAMAEMVADGTHKRILRKYGLA